MKNFFLSALLLTSVAFKMNAQNIGPGIINAAGGSANIGSATYEFSIGEMAVVHTASTGNIVVTHGVLQPLMKATSIKDADFFKQFLSLYPNPTQNIVYFQPAFRRGGILSFQLFDVVGRLVMDGSFDLKYGSEKQQIVLGHLVSGSYMLHVRFEQGVNTFNTAYKIQKLD